jgi:hypothetical protein
VVEIAAIDPRTGNIGGEVGAFRHQLEAAAVKVLGKAAQRNPSGNAAADTFQGKLRLAVAAAYAVEAIDHRRPVGGVGKC